MPRQHSGPSADIHPGHTPRTTAVPQEEAYDDDADAAPPLPRSARRYRQSPAQEDAPVARKRQGGKGAFYALVIGSSILAGIVIATVVPPLWQGASDQLHYGFPRTYQIDANVGHGSRQYPDTHFIALNNHGYIEVIEIAQGVPGKNSLHLYLLGQPDNANADEAPVTLAVEDVNGDGKPDLVASCNDNKYILYNDGHAFTQQP